MLNMYCHAININYARISRTEFKNQFFNAVQFLNQKKGYLSHRVSIGSEEKKFCVFEIFFSNESDMNEFSKYKFPEWNEFLGSIEALVEITENSFPVETLGADGCSG